MLYKQNRLAKKKDFEAVFQKGQTAKAGFLYIKFKENGLKCSRFGFIVSKKVSNKATRRNLVKRRLRNAIRLKINEIAAGFDIAFVALPAILNKKYKEIDEEIAKTLKSANLMQ